MGYTGTNGGVSLTNSTVSGNLSESNGGGIYVSDGDLLLTNSTVSGNSIRLSGSGAGIRSSDSTVLLVSSTVTANITSQSTGAGIVFSGYNSDEALLTVQNSILAGNTSQVRTGSPGYASDLQILGSATNDPIVEYSLIGSTTRSRVTEATGTGNILDQPALLTQLGDYGGATQTHALQAGSPAIDAGSNALAVDESGNLLTSDQRGERRISGTIDMGAIELGTLGNLEARSLIVNTSQDVTDPNDGLTSLREAIRFANDPTVGPNSDGDADGDGFVADSITFDASVFTAGDSNLIRLTRGELEITQSLSIDGSLVGGVVITGDAADNDITVGDTHVTDVSASFGGIAGASNDLLDDNSRVLNFSDESNLTLTSLTLTGGQTSEDRGGGGILAGGSVSLNNSKVSGNNSLYRGGGIFFSDGQFAVEQQHRERETAVLGPAAGVFSFGDVSLTNSTVSENIAEGLWRWNSYSCCRSITDQQYSEWQQ